MNPRSECECEHEFVLVLRDIVELTPEDEDALFNAGCDDATISVRAGRVFMTFSRTDSSLRSAILGAIQQVRKANIGADVLRVDNCNLVSQSDIARRIGRTRQQVHQYITGARGPGNFPPPACQITEGAPLWYWCEVAYWLCQNDMIKENAARDARDVAAINAILEMNYHRCYDPELLDELVGALADHS